MFRTGPLVNATFFLYSAESLFSSALGACGPAAAGVGVCFARDGEAACGVENRPFDLTVDSAFAMELSSVDERAADCRLRLSCGDLAGKLRTCSRKGAE
jgi:hypothetical protein